MLPEILYVEWPEFDAFHWYGEDGNWDHFYTLFPQGSAGYWQAICLRMEKLVGEPLLCQMVPTLRAYAPYEKPPYDWHTDTEFGHPRGLINLWIPLCTVPAGTICTQHQSLRAMEPGEGAIFSGSELHHAATLGRYRVSIDGRFLKERDWKPTGRYTNNTHQRIDIGTYYLRSNDLRVIRK